MSAAPYTLLTFNGVTFAARADEDFNANGYVISFRTIDGWYDAAPDDTRTLDHPSGIGTLVEDEAVGPRQIRVRGLIRAASATAMLVGWDVLRSRHRGTFRVDEDVRDVTREVTARRVGLTPERFTELFWGYTLDVIADDPLIYTSDTRNLSNGTQTIPNTGDEQASPTLTLTGPHSALTIAHPGGTYHFNALTSGQSRLLDFRNGDVWDGSSRVFGVESGPRPVVRSGGSPWTVSGLGSGSAVLSRYAAWS